MEIINSTSTSSVFTNLWFGKILRLEPVIIELERQRAPVVVISHQVNL